MCSVVPVRHISPARSLGGSGYYCHYWASLHVLEARWQGVTELEPISLEVLGPPDHAVDIVVISAAGVFIVHLEVAGSCMVGANSPWKESRGSCCGLINQKYRF